MQHLASFRFWTSQLHRLIDFSYFNKNQFIFPNRNIFSLKQYSSNISVNSKNEYCILLYSKHDKQLKSTEATHVLDHFEDGQSSNKINSPSTIIPRLNASGEARSLQNLHVIPLSIASIRFIHTSVTVDKTVHETAVHTTQDASLATSRSVNDVPSSSQHTTEFEDTTKVFGDQQASTATKKHLKDNPFGRKILDGTSDANENLIHRENDLREDILRESLKYVNERGWTMDSIRAGICALNQPTTIEGLFSTEYDLIEHFMRSANYKMSAYMSEQAKKGDIQGSRLLAEGLKYRLGLVIPYCSTWDQVLAQGALPQNALRSWKNLLELSSEAWYGIGDTSTDINWYSKRLLLAAIYKTAEIYMLQDQSTNKSDSINFLERCLNDFQATSSVRKTISKAISDTTQLASGFISVVRNLTSRR